ncbi:T6SS effector BTH_I2691 family protein, partial [uncultured Cedecea sp.]|uniref:T6SS effector BTH_I2691 family protein n=1 Tax=uncultured Cedecea sp. TaxID=988762 RepID=UPI0026050B05
VPVFPLRVAAVPKALVNSGWKPVVPKQDVELTGGDFKYALRTLRMGYLYVLLDNRIWQAYQVTAEGYLRQFDPMAMPEGDTVEPISKACREQGHCINASFINIDDKKYQKAALAFSSDPWSKDVLDEYKSGKRPSGRFTEIVLATLKSTPSSVEGAFVIDPSLASMKANVAEFATDFFVNTPKVIAERAGGAHGFYPRIESENALGLRVAQLGVQYQCQIAALALNDCVGVVQELNNSRLEIVEARQLYNELPEIRCKYMISEAIEQYLTALKARTDESSKPRHESTVSGYPAAGYTIPAQQVARETYAGRLAHLQKYYHESKRAEFVRQHQQMLQGYQQRIEAIGKDLAAWYQAPFWLATITHDYAPETCPAGWAAQLSTIATCIQGGSTDEETEKVWLKWLEDPASPAYLGILGNKKSVLEDVFRGSAGYTNLKALLNGKEIGDWIDSEGVQKAIAQRMLAMSGAFSRLNEKLDQAVLDGYSRIVQGNIYLTTGKQVTVFNVTMTVREYQQLHRDIARVQLSMNGKAIEYGGELRNGKRALRRASTNGLPQVSDPVVLRQKLTLTMVAESAPAEFIQSLNNGKLTSSTKLNELSELRIADVSLDNTVSRAPVKLTQSQKGNVTKGQVQLSRRLISGNALGGILGGGMLFLQVSALADNIKAVETAVNSVNARFTLVSNMTMVVSSAVETSGFIHMLVRANPWDLTPNVVVKGVPIYVHPLLRLGGGIAGFSSLIDGIGMWVKAYDAKNAGETDAANWYRGAGIVTIGGGFLFIYSAYSCSFALMGPMGLAALLVIAGATMAIQAENAIRSPFEVWLSAGCFGVTEKRGGKDPVWDIDSPEDLYAALMAYKVIVSGMTAEMDYQNLMGKRGDSEDAIKMRVRLPGCNSTDSAWDLKLVAQGDGGSKPLLVSQYGIKGIKDSASSLTDDGSHILRHPRHPSLPLNNTLTQRWDSNALLLEGLAWVSTRYGQAILNIDYWPDKNDPQSLMTLTLKITD